jgi:hypothetical protein
VKLLGVSSGVIVFLGVLARTGEGGEAVYFRAPAFLPHHVSLLCRYCAWRVGEAHAAWPSGCAHKSVGTRKSPSYLARRLATAGLQLAAAMMIRIRIIHRCTHGGGSSPLWLCGEPPIMSPRTGQGDSHVLESLPACSCIFWACTFRAGGDASIFFTGPVAEGRNSCPFSTGCSPW